MKLAYNSKKHISTAMGCCQPLDFINCNSNVLKFNHSQLNARYGQGMRNSSSIRAKTIKYLFFGPQYNTVTFRSGLQYLKRWIPYTFSAVTLALASHFDVDVNIKRKPFFGYPFLLDLWLPYFFCTCIARRRTNYVIGTRFKYASKHICRCFTFTNYAAVNNKSEHDFAQTIRFFSYLG